MHLLPRSPSTPLVALTLTLSVGLIGVPSPSQAAEPSVRMLAPMLLEAPAAPPRVALRVNTDDLDGTGEPMKKKIVEVATGVFNEQGIADTSDEHDPRIVIVVERTGDEENPGFVVGFSIEKGADVVAGSARQLDCSLCTRTELVERIEKELPSLLDLARQHQVPREAVGGDGDGDGGDGDGPAVVPGETKKIGPLGFAGIGIGAAGLVGVGVGVGFVITGTQPLDERGWELRDYRTPGIVISAVGGAALIAGVVMIVLDVRKRNQANAGARATRVEPRGLGIAF